MKTGRRYSFIFILPALLCATVNGQVRQPHSLYFMETIPQISQMNPALQPRANSYVSLPNVNIDFCSDLAVKNILQKQGDSWYTPVEKQYDYKKLRRAIGKNATMFNLGVDVDFIGFGFRTYNGYFSFGLSEHVSANFALPSDLFNVTDKGFPDGTALDFSPLRTRGLAYMQLLLGYSHKVSDKLTIGVNVKPLIGHAAAVSKIDKVELLTGTQQWDLDAKGNIYSSGFVDKIITNEKGKIESFDSIKIKDFKNYKVEDALSDYILNFNNLGVAFDFGAAYRFDERLTVSASLNNLGFISWKNDLNSISFGGKYNFNGVTYDYPNDKNFGDLFSTLGDSIANALNYDVKQNKFMTSLTPVLHVGASYKLTEGISVGLLSRSAFWKNGVRQSFNGSIYLQPYSFVSMNLGATYQVKGSVHLGGGFQFLLGPLQIYFLVDNVPVYYSTIKVFKADQGDVIETTLDLPYAPERFKTVTMRVGFNLVFGRHGYVNKPMLDKGKSSWN